MTIYVTIYSDRERCRGGEVVETAEKMAYKDVSRLSSICFVSHLVFISPRTFFACSRPPCAGAPNFAPHKYY